MAYVMNAHQRGEVQMLANVDTTCRVCNKPVLRGTAVYAKSWAAIEAGECNHPVCEVEVVDTAAHEKARLHKMLGASS